MAMLQEDIISSLPWLDSRRLCNVFLSAAYQQNRDPALLAPLCEGLLSRAHTLNLRDVTTLIYAMGRLEYREEDKDSPLLRELLGRAQRETPRMLGVEMVKLSLGLAALRLSLPDLLHPLCRTAVQKLDQFGAIELSSLLGSLTTLRHKDISLLRAACVRLPEVITDMNPRALVETAAALAAADQTVWILSLIHI